MNDSSKLVDYDVTEGGVIVRVGDEQGLDLTIANEKVKAIRANLTKTQGLIAALGEAIPGMLADLAQALAELGEPCAVCGGEEGEEDRPDNWAYCVGCGGSGVQRKAAA